MGLVLDVNNLFQPELWGRTHGTDLSRQGLFTDKQMGERGGLLVKIHLKIRCAFLSILFARALLSILVEICSNFDRNEMQWHSLLLQHIPPQAASKVSRQKHQMPPILQFPKKVPTTLKLQPNTSSKFPQRLGIDSLNFIPLSQ